MKRLSRARAHNANDSESRQLFSRTRVGRFVVSRTRELDDAIGINARIAIQLEAHGHVSAGDGGDKLLELSVRDDEILKTATVNSAALSGQAKERWIDQKLLVAIRLGTGSVRDTTSLF